MAQNKRDKMRAGMARARQELTPEQSEHLRKDLLGPKSGIRRMLFTLYVEDLDWLKKTTASLKRSRRRTAKSELMRLGIALMKEKSQEELLTRLRNLE
jgi:hypothetical protein